MSAQSQINSLIGTTTAGVAALTHTLNQKEMSKDLKKVAATKGKDSYAAQLASDKWRQKAQAIKEQRERYTQRMAGGVFNDSSRQKAIAAREAMDKKSKTSFNVDTPKTNKDEGGK